MVPTLVKGSASVFDVFVNDRLIFSKHKSGRFPDEKEVLDLLPEP